MAPVGKQILVWVVILALAFALSRRVIESKQQEREVNTPLSWDPLALCSGRTGQPRRPATRPGEWCVM